MCVSVTILLPVGTVVRASDCTAVGASERTANCAVDCTATGTEVGTSDCSV